MTEKLQPLSTQIANPSQNLATPTSATPVAQAKELPHKVEIVEEEPYTIKCICNFPDDDGNTIFCETCETWQHIDCFYPDNREEALLETFSHSCHQCKPRPLDHKRAIERTQKLRNALVEEHDKKPKRPTSKSHKKKPKPNDLQLNGNNHTSHDSSAKHPSPSDHHPPAKKAKTSHRSSHSISSQPSKKSPAHAHAKLQTNGLQQQPSPANTPPDPPIEFELHNYSANFFSLHSEDDVQIVQNNSFASLTISNTMSLWLQDRDRLKKETGQEYKDVFQKLPANIESIKSALRVEHKSYSPTPGRKLRLQYLATPSAVEKDVPLMELNGQIGFQKDYCADFDNLWHELTSPLPFVFFHPLLPLYIDTRREGSEARYVRRSCKPNAVLDTYLSDGSEYHFWLVSDRHIAAKEQITLPWDFRFPNEEKARLLYLLGLGDDEMGASEQPDMDETEYRDISTWLHRLLSEYGGCACDLGINCAFARFHRHYLAKTQPRAAQQKKKRKAKAQNVSPTSTGYATNSRAASEGHLDDGPDIDARSTSSRSKPPSRDRTPFHQGGAFDQLGILTEPTDRDKRKVAMAEEKFRLMEQQQQPQRKKKRVVSDGASSTKSKSARTPAGTTPNLSNGHYVDAGTSRSKSGSPASAFSPRAQFPPFAMAKPDSVRPLRRPSSAPHANYCDAAVQTDPVDGEWFSALTPSPQPRRRVISLSQRLLNNRHRQKLDEAERKKVDVANSESGAMDIDSPGTEHPSASSSPILTKDSVSTTTTSPAPTSTDIAMADIASTSPTMVSSQLNVDGTESTAAGPSKTRTPDLRVQMPPVPAFTNAGSASLTNTPVSGVGSLVQSPFSATNLASPFGPSAMNGVQPSPVKKKLSLSDYRKSRMDKDKAAGKTALPATKPISEEAKPELNGDSLIGDKSIGDTV